jgi:hypothetical protein
MIETVRQEDLPDIYDVGFLGFILNENPDAVSGRLVEGSHTLSPDKEDVLDQLVALENQLRTLPDAQRKFERSARLAHYDEGLSSTVLSYFRKVCGGTVSLPPTSDDVERLLLHFAEVTYPLRLQNDKDGEPSSVRIPWHDPMRQELQAAVMADGVLSKLYPTDSEHAGPTGSTLRSTGQGGGVQLWMFTESITTAAWHSAHFDSAQPSFEEYARAVLQIVRTLKKALQGKKAEVPMRIGLAGVLLPEGVDSVDFGWARARRADQRDEHFTQRTSVEGQLHHTNSKGESLMIDYAGNLVLEFNVPYKILLKEIDMAAPWPEELNQTSLIGEPIECLRLALLLAGIGENSAAAPTWQSVVDPLYSAESIGWNDPRQRTNLLPVQLTEAQVALWKEWTVRIHDNRTPQTSVSIRRILRAVSEQKEPEDTLIDAIVVWENLFGAGQETTLRITMSVAWMLGADGDSRTKLFNDLKKVYQQRSDIVHGNAKLKTDKTYPYARQAIDISIKLLRIMFKDRPELLQLKTGAERSALALLDARENIAD